MQGNLSGQRQGQPVFITRLEVGFQMPHEFPFHSNFGFLPFKLQIHPHVWLICDTHTSASFFIPQIIIFTKHEASVWQ